MNWYLEAFKKYAVFSGRSRRKEYWYFFLFSMIISFILGFIEGLLGLGGDEDFSILGAVYALIVFLPSIALGVRRLHDIGRTGWWLLIVLIPFLGFLIFLIFMVQDSEPVPNKYGANPKESSGNDGSQNRSHVSPPSLR